MSEMIEKAVEAITEKLGDASFDGSAKFAIEGLGSVIIDGDGVRVGDDETDVTLSAEADVFHDILTGDLNPTAAFMQGKLSVDGDMGAAMKLASVLA